MPVMVGAGVFGGRQGEKNILNWLLKKSKVVGGIAGLLVQVIVEAQPAVPGPPPAPPPAPRKVKPLTHGGAAGSNCTVQGPIAGNVADCKNRIKLPITGNGLPGKLLYTQ